jgi:RHS repeat-associated protein
LTDNQGTVRDLAVYNAQTGVTSVANHRVYDSFGTLESQTNAAVDCLFGFAGLPYDEASGTYVTPTRRYAPATGGWLSPDPTGLSAGDTNLYRYAGNSPTNAADPSGLAPQIPPLGCLGAPNLYYAADDEVPAPPTKGPPTPATPVPIPPSIITPPLKPEEQQPGDRYRPLREGPWGPGGPFNDWDWFRRNGIDPHHFFGEIPGMC